MVKYKDKGFWIRVGIIFIILSIVGKFNWMMEDIYMTLGGFIMTLLISIGLASLPIWGQKKNFKSSP